MRNDILFVVCFIIVGLYVSVILLMSDQTYLLCRYWKGTRFVQINENFQRINRCVCVCEKWRYVTKYSWQWCSDSLWLTLLATLSADLLSSRTSYMMHTRICSLESDSRQSRRPVYTRLKRVNANVEYCMLLKINYKYSTLESWNKWTACFCERRACVKYGYKIKSACRRDA